MIFFSRKNKKQKLEQKSYDALSNFCEESFSNYLFSGSNYDLGFILLNSYYKKCGPVNDAIDRIAKEFSSIEPKLYDKEKKEFIDTNILSILDNPNVSMNKCQFLKNIAITYLVTGNILLTASGVTKIQELSYIEPQYVTIQSNKLNDIDYILVNKDYYSDKFTVKETSDSNFLISQNQNKIGVFLREYNTSYNYSNQFGLSRLLPISEDIEQYLLSADHNKSILKKGARLSGTLTTENALNDDQVERLKEQISRYYSGTANAGNVMVLESGLKFTGTTMTNVDMDYKSMRDSVVTMIYRKLEIPLALISETSMTYNNLAVANLMLYDNAVLPLAKMIYSHLEDLIFYHTNTDSDRYQITYDENSIPALAFRKSQIIQQKSDSNAYTFNEIRAMRGDPRLDSGGDEIYMPSNNIPVADNTYDSLNNNEETNEESADNKAQ
ncbi:phage portal protein [Fangia hongkongensis]|uniref:phage portal protein n=2 Tax=Fangia hongkongensis TaxID=270495 RepID=UPI000371DDC4|nr:phage portal protein [Fangia hongkongensis]